MESTEKLAGISLIDNSEEFVFQPYKVSKPEVVIVYRRVDGMTQQEIRVKHTKDDRNGKSDEVAINMEVLNKGLVRFEHIYTKPGVVANATAENLAKLDSWIFQRLLLLVCGQAPGYVHISPLDMQDSSLNSK